MQTLKLDAMVDNATEKDVAHVTPDVAFSDTSLIALLCQQDKQALGILYDRYGTLVYTLALFKVVAYLPQIIGF